MERLSVCPSTLAEGFDSYSPTALKSLFDGINVSPILPFNSPNSDSGDNSDYAQHIGRISLSGVQPKASLILSPDHQLVKPTKNERGRYILKPAPSSYTLLERKSCPANEHLSMQIASQVYHIETAPNALCFFRDGEAAYITRRFDVAPDGTKYQQEDFASLAGLTKANGGSDYKYNNLSYEECAELIHRYTTAASVEVLKFFRIVVFNYMILNDDAHLKNFSLINRGDGEYHLAPAYDLTLCTEGYNGEHATSVNGTGHPTQKDFIAVGTKIKMNEQRCREIIEEVRLGCDDIVRYHIKK